LPVRRIECAALLARVIRQLLAQRFAQDWVSGGFAIEIGLRQT
jgi:hypothetical protein